MMKQKVSSVTKIFLMFVCFTLTACLVQKNDEAFRQNIVRDLRLVGDWRVLKWSDIQVETCPQCQSLSVMEGKQDEKPIYMLLTDHVPYKEEIRGGSLTAYQFGNSHFLLAGFPDGGCTSCHLLKYNIDGDVLKVSGLNIEKAAEFLSQFYPQQTGFEYKVQNTSDVTVKDLSPQTTAILDDMARQPDLWGEMIILKRK